MDYEKRYKNALERAKYYYNEGKTLEYANDIVSDIFSEFKESEDEKIRKEIITYLSTVEDKELIPYESWIDWLEKQSEQKPVEWSEKDENEYNHILKILNLVAEEQKTKGYNNLISSTNWLKSFKDRIQSKQSNKPQGKSALEAINEKTVDNSNKIVNSKFKVGDWVVRKDGRKFCNGYKFAQITEIDGEKHWFDTDITYKPEDIRLWTIADAEDGDILYSKKHNLIWCYKNIKECYGCINLNYNSNNISFGNNIVIPNDVRPISKEQRDLLFDKMLQHTMSVINDKKEMKKQGEHNPTDNDDKIEAKFHEGDWIVVRGEVILICDIRNDLYDVIFADGEHRLYDTNILDKESRLWTIEDAQDGDVLVASDGSIFIFAGVVDYACKYYAALTLYNGISINKEVELGSWELSNHVHPATKEQCDLLFAKMRERGYKWNNEKKEVIGRI